MPRNVGIAAVPGASSPQRHRRDQAPLRPAASPAASPPPRRRPPTAPAAPAAATAAYRQVPIALTDFPSEMDVALVRPPSPSPLSQGHDTRSRVVRSHPQGRSSTAAFKARAAGRHGASATQPRRLLPPPAAPANLTGRRRPLLLHAQRQITCLPKPRHARLARHRCFGGTGDNCRSSPRASRL